VTNDSRLRQEAHAQRGRRSIHHQFGMFAAKGFGNVAVPADGPMCAQHFLKLLSWNLVPLDGLEGVVEQGERMIVPVDFSKWLVAIRAVLSLVPLIDDRPNQPGLRRFLNLRQTLLAASFLFGPARACTQSQLLIPNC
jgi:hypothetical protein